MIPEYKQSNCDSLTKPRHPPDVKSHMNKEYWKVWSWQYHSPASEGFDEGLGFRCRKVLLHLCLFRFTVVRGWISSIHPNLSSNGRHMVPLCRALYNIGSELGQCSWATIISVWLILCDCFVWNRYIFRVGQSCTEPMKQQGKRDRVNG